MITPSILISNDSLGGVPRVFCRSVRCRFMRRNMTLVQAGIRGELGRLWPDL
jgi:phosphoribosyl 1,2-cyclic phosphodiesterase